MRSKKWKLPKYVAVTWNLPGCPPMPVIRNQKLDKFGRFYIIGETMGCNAYPEHLTEAKLEDKPVHDKLLERHA